MAIGGLALGGEIDSNLPSPRTDQTILNFHNSGILAAVTQYTVPAGKVVYITDMVISGVGGVANAALYSDATAVLQGRALENVTTPIPLKTPIAFAAGVAIKLTQTTADTSTDIVGWEESA